MHRAAYLAGECVTARFFFIGARHAPQEGRQGFGKFAGDTAAAVIALRPIEGYTKPGAACSATHARIDTFVHGVDTTAPGVRPELKLPIALREINRIPLKSAFL